MVNLDDIVIHLKQNFNEFERKTEKEIFNKPQKARPQKKAKFPKRIKR